MSTTINRQLSLLVKGILVDKYKIDNLQLEIDLVSALQRMWTEGGRDPAKLSRLREEILSALLGQGKLENDKALMEGRVKACMNISIDGRSRYDEMVRFLVKKDAEGQRVEQYAVWCKENPFEAPKAFQISQRPDLLMETWTMAFSEKQESEQSQSTGTGFYA